MILQLQFEGINFGRAPYTIGLMVTTRAAIPQLSVSSFDLIIDPTIQEITGKNFRTFVVPIGSCQILFCKMGSDGMWVGEFQLALK
jgi:hypothetical protein